MLFRRLACLGSPCFSFFRSTFFVTMHSESVGPDFSESAFAFEQYDASHPLSSKPLKSIWKSVSRALIARIGELPFDRWFRPLNLAGLGPGGALIGAPNSIYQLWIEENFRSELVESFNEVVTNWGGVVRYTFGAKREVSDHDSAADGLAEEAEGVVETLKKVELKPSKDPYAFPSRDKSSRIAASGLSDRYRFDNLVVGEHIRVAFSAATAVAERPGRSYHPLLVYAPSGLGKTHLLHAIGWEVLRLRPKFKVTYVSGEEFTNDFIEALKANQLVPFRKRYREADVLLIDDVQFIANKDSTQEEFFHTFNALTDRCRQVVLTSDVPPGEIRGLQERLVTRFQWGLTVAVVSPGMETRIAILRRKREEWELDVTDEQIELIASNIESNVRLLEGAIRHVAVLNTMFREEPSKMSLEEIEREMVAFRRDQEGADVSVDLIQSGVAAHFNLQIEDLYGKSRLARISNARQVAMFLTRELTDLSLKEIGSCFGGRDHGTVLHALKTVVKKKEMPDFRQTLESIRRDLSRTKGRQEGGRQTHHLPRR